MSKVLALVFLVLMIAPPAAGSYHDPEESKIQKVEVINLPKTQEVFGAVSVSGRLSHSIMERKEGISVPPVPRSRTNDMIRVGTIETDGFTSMQISIQGESISSLFSPGTVGVILVPEETPIMRAFIDDNKILFPVEVKSELNQNLFPYFVSASEQFAISFPRYKVFIYNSTNKSAEVNLYIYLTH